MGKRGRESGERRRARQTRSEQEKGRNADEDREREAFRAGGRERAKRRDEEGEAGLARDRSSIHPERAPDVPISSRFLLPALIKIRSRRSAAPRVAFSKRNTLVARVCRGSFLSAPRLRCVHTSRPLLLFQFTYSFRAPSLHPGVTLLGRASDSR